MKHKHADIIKAWADGETVQYYNIFCGDWQDVAHDIAAWHPSEKYRIKPKTIRYRAALMASAHSEYETFALSQLEEEVVSEDANFVRWLTDWIEVAT